MTMKIDKRHHYVLVVDTETANTLMREDGKMDMSCVLMYDCGWCVMDTKGKVQCGMVSCTPGEALLLSVWGVRLRGYGC